METLIIAYIKDLMTFLNLHRDFFKETRQKRQDILKPVFEHESLFLLFLDFSEKDFFHALREAVIGKPNLFFDAISSYFLKDFPQPFDQLNRAFYQASLAEQKTMVKKKFPKDSSFFDVLRNQLLLLSHQEFTDMILQWLDQLYQSPIILIQSPLECDLSLKTSIRSLFSKTRSKSFVAFHVSRQLIGGIRCFINGKVSDFSWFSQIQKIRQLSSTL